MSLKFGTSGLRGLVAEMTDPRLRGACARLPRPPARRRGRAAARGAGRAGPAAELAPDRGGLPAGGPGRGDDGGRLRRGADAGAGAGGGAARGGGGDGDRQPHPLRPQRAEVLPARRRGDQQGRRGGDPRRAGRAGARRGPGAVRVDSGVGARYVARSVAFFGAGCLAGLRVGLYEHSAAGRDEMRARAGSARGGGGRRSGGATSFVPIDTEAIPPEEAARIRGWVVAAPAGGAGVDGRRRRPAARRRRDGAGAARRRARGAGGAAPRGGRGGGAAERQHGAGAVGVVRAGRCARGSARRTSSRGWRG